MRKIDRKNRRKVKIAQKARDATDSAEKYSCKGAYKTILFVSLSEDMASHYIDCLVNTRGFKILGTAGNTYSVMDPKKKIRCVFVNGDGLSDHEISHVSRHSDLSVMCVGNDLSRTERHLLVQRNTTKVLFCCNAREDVKALKGLGESKTRAKVIFKDMLADALIKLQTSGEGYRPVLIPDSYVFDKGSNLVCDVFLENGLVGKRFLCNGVHEVELEEIVTDRVHSADDVFSINEGITYHMDGESRTEDETMEDNGEVDMESNNDSVQEEGVSEEAYEDEPRTEHELLCDKYKDYKSLRDISDAAENSENSGELVLLKNYKHAEGRCLKQHKHFFKGERVTLKFKSNAGLTSLKVVVLANLFNLETGNTIYNVYFDSTTEVRQRVLLLADNGVRVFAFSPLLSESSNLSVLKAQECLVRGVMTFVGPLTVRTGRINIYRASASGEITAQGYVCSGVVTEIGSCLIAEEQRITGCPYKINKKHCVVRSMFNNKSDVLHFLHYGVKAAKNNWGIIKEPVGTHGLFKAYFSRPVKHGEKITLAMYRRVFPWTP